MGTPRIWPIALFLMTSVSPQARAQGVAGSFEQLRLLVQTGDTVTVRESSGAQTTGRIDMLSSSALTLVVSGTPREFRETDVNVILQRRGDPLSNGAKWGFITGAGVGVAAAVASCDGCDDLLLVSALSVGIYGAIGVGIGVGVDALITGRRVIYQRREPATSWRLTPFVGKGRRGVALSMRF
jgi:hypothetical protein